MGGIKVAYPSELHIPVDTCRVARIKRSVYSEQCAIKYLTEASSPSMIGKSGVIRLKRKDLQLSDSLIVSVIGLCKKNKTWVPSHALLEEVNGLQVCSVGLR